MMELRKRGKEECQENIPSAKNPAKEAIFRKLTNVCRMARKKNSAHVFTEGFVRILGELGLKISKI
jgi:hypothetical protein